MTTIAYLDPALVDVLKSDMNFADVFTGIVPTNTTLKEGGVAMVIDVNSTYIDPLYMPSRISDMIRSYVEIYGISSSYRAVREALEKVRRELLGKSFTKQIGGAGNPKIYFDILEIINSETDYDRSSRVWKESVIFKIFHKQQ